MILYWTKLIQSVQVYFKLHDKRYRLPNSLERLPVSGLRIRRSDVSSILPMKSAEDITFSLFRHSLWNLHSRLLVFGNIAYRTKCRNQIWGLKVLQKETKQAKPKVISIRSKSKDRICSRKIPEDNIIPGCNHFSWIMRTRLQWKSCSWGWWLGWNWTWAYFCCRESRWRVRCILPAS